MTQPERFRPVRSSRPTRAVDLRSNGPHRSAFRPVRSYLASVRTSRPTGAVDPGSNDLSRPLWNFSKTSPSKLPPKAPFESPSGRPPFKASSGKPFEPTSLDDPPSEPLRNLTRVPERTPPSEPFDTFPKPCRRPLFEASTEAPAGPPFGERHLSRKPFLRKPLSTRLRTKPFGPSFGTRHVSRGLSRKTPSKMAYVPEALPRIPPEAFFETPHLPDSSRVATCPRIPRTGRISPGCRPSLPSVSECRAKTLPPGALRAAT